MEFEFDAEKSAANLAKHGIDFVAAQALWRGRIRVRLLPYPLEERWACIGAINGVVWTAIVTYRGNRTRIISVRPASRRERRIYGAA